MKPKGNPNPSSNRDKEDFPGYPHYGKNEDIYSNAEEDKSIDPERPDRKEAPQTPPDTPIKDEMASEFVDTETNVPGSQDRPSRIEADEDEDEDLEDDDEELLSTEESDLGYDDLGLQDEFVDPNEKAAGGRTDGDELDVPGAELDDDQEALGSEDEENNYYSLGGDNHDDDSREPDTYSGR